MDTIIIKLLESAGFPLLLLVIGWLVGKYVTPWVHKNQARVEKAREIALIADRITDEIMFMFPTLKWDDYLDKIVDKLIDSMDINPEIAQREVIHQLQKRKTISVNSNTPYPV